MVEGRRSARIATEFFVAVEGLESEPVLRKGNISTTGIYFQTDKDVGEVGMISWLSILSADRTRAVHVMAYVVRRVRVSDAGGRETRGAAFEFMPESKNASAAVDELVRHVLSLRRGPGEEPRVSSRLDALVTPAPPKVLPAVTATTKGPDTTPAPPPVIAEAGAHATIDQLTVRSLTLETSWAVTPGDAVVVDIHAPGMAGRIRLEGRAIRVEKKASAEESTTPPRYAIELEVQQETERPLRSMAPPPDESGAPPPSVPLAIQAMDDDEVSRTIDDLLGALIMPTPPPPAVGLAKPPRPPRRTTHLSGLLSRIPLTTLCSLFEMERITGKLVVRPAGAADKATDVYVRDGQLLDVEPVPEDMTPRDRLAALLTVPDGSFEFYVQPVDRPDRMGTSTTALLLDLARTADESKRDDV